MVATAARHGITVLPDVQQAPAWASRHPGNPASPPSGTAPYANFMAALATRYGPNGTFWKANPKLPQLPIHDWQIWNEPDATKYWSDQPFVADYVALLKAARTALRGVDPGARAVLAGFPSRSWVSLARLYKAGARPYFDVAAVHPFSLPVTNITRILKEDRRVMAKYHDSKKPIFITETSWPSALGKTTTKYGFEVTRSGEAAKARSVLQLLAAERRQFNLERVYWYTWISLDQSKIAPFDYAGLQTFTPASKAREEARLQGIHTDGAADRGLPLQGARGHQLPPLAGGPYNDNGPPLRDGQLSVFLWCRWSCALVLLGLLHGVLLDLLHRVLFLAL